APPWSPAAPPAWFAAWPEVVTGHGSGPIGLAALLGVVTLPLCALLLVRALGHGFLDDLRRLLSSTASAPATARSRRFVRVAPSAWVRALFGLASPDAEAGYLLHAASSRSRESRARVLPMLAMPIVFSVL